MNKTLITILACCLALVAQAGAPLPQGGVWADTEGRHINAHGGCVIRHGDQWLWYGEQRPDADNSIAVGVSVYSSPDLAEWTYRGTALSMDTLDSSSPIAPGCIIERPKVMYNPATEQFVMWFHNELPGRGYAAAQAAVAVSPTPYGPFTLLRSGRVNPGIWPLNLDAAHRHAPDAGKLAQEWWTPEWRADVADGLFVQRDLDGGQMARDMTLWRDPDTGTAYHVYSSEDNLTLQIAELDSTWTRHTGRYIRLMPGGHNEAPMLFKQDGRYWMVTSGCTGWAPNEARLLVADDILGEWTQLPNPCTGPDAKTTFGGQGNYILELGNGRRLAMFDRWRPKALYSSPHVWLPVITGADGIPYIPWNPLFTPPSYVQ